MNYIAYKVDRTHDGSHDYTYWTCRSNDGVIHREDTEEDAISEAKKWDNKKRKKVAYLVTCLKADARYITKNGRPMMIPTSEPTKYEAVVRAFSEEAARQSFINTYKDYIIRDLRIQAL